MKKIMFAAVSALALSALADGVDSTQFGALKVEMTVPTKRTLVAIPWENTAAGGGDIVVSNLVLTANLQEGDTLDIMDGATSLNRWTLVEGEDGVLYWYSGTMVTEGDKKKLTPSADSAGATIKRGSAVVLIRNGESRDYTVPFYVMGQVASGSPTTTITAGSSDAPCYSMIAPPSTTNQYLNGSEHAATWGNTSTITGKDRIIIPTQYLNIELMYTNSNWCSQSKQKTTKYYLITQDEETKKYSYDEVDKGTPGAITRVATETVWTPYAGTIPMGTGFWYVSYGGSPTVTWSDVPSKD